MFLKKIKTINQSGSTLILSIVILAAVLITAVTFSVIALLDFKQASNIDQSIISYYRAELGLERGLYYFRKFDEGISDCKLDGGGCALEVQREVEINISTLAKDSSIQVDIYDPLNPASIPDITKLIPTWTGNGWLEISIVGWGAQIGDPQKELRSSGSSGINIILNSYCTHGPCNFYRVRFKALIDDVTDFKVFAENAAGEQQNIPGIADVKSIGSYRNSQQAIAITTNLLSPLSGLYDYVIFSEEELTKAYCGDGVVEGSEQCDNGKQCDDLVTDCTADESVCEGIGTGQCLPRDGDGCSPSCEI